MKKLLLLLLCLPLLGIGAAEAFRLAQKAIHGSPAPFAEEEKNVQEKAREMAVAFGRVRPKIKLLALTGSEKKMIDEGLSAPEKDLAGSLNPLADQLAETRSAFKILHEQPDNPPKLPEDFGAWHKEWSNSKSYQQEALGLCKALMEAVEKKPDLGTIVKNLEDARKHWQTPRPDYFIQQAAEGDAVIKNCLKVVNLLQKAKPEKSHFEELDELVRGTPKKYHDHFRALAKVVALTWADNLLPKKLEYDDEVLVRTWTTNPKSRAFKTNRIKITLDQKEINLDDQRELQFLDRPLDIEGERDFIINDEKNGYRYRLQPTPKSWVAHAYNGLEARNKKLTAALIKSFQADFGKNYCQIAEVRKLTLAKPAKDEPLSPALQQLQQHGLSNDVRVLDTILALQGYLTTYPKLFE